MNLYKIGDMTLNMDRVNGYQEIHVPAGSEASAGQHAVRVLFDNGSIDLTGAEAQALRQWIRHQVHNLTPKVDEDGERLIGPEDQLRSVTSHLLALIDNAGSKDAAVRSTAHRLSALIDNYLTGQLKSVRAKGFEKRL